MLVPLGVKPVKETGIGVAVHENVVFRTLEVNVTIVDGLPEHTDCDNGMLVTRAVGFTVMV